MSSGVDGKLGLYRVVREIGRGGMGVVYLARDTRLNRDVAIKALPEELASDPARLERFEREARTLASLNHPNIGAIYGVGIPERLFGGDEAGVDLARGFDIAPDGQGVLAVKALDGGEDAKSALILVQNWYAESDGR